MMLATSLARLQLCFAAILIIGGQAQGLSWGKGSPQRVTKGSAKSSHAASQSLTDGIVQEGRISDTYSIALQELRELESEPLCHRVAARLLVNNCQLIDGQNDATVYLDSGRAARDFVDSYAASLAICDLERGSFAIPPSCSKFREPALAVLHTPDRPQLHVSTSEINDCLEGLGHSDSAWNTWVSYRHKALRFCDAARADNDKDRTIHLYQRVTQIIQRLTTQVEKELEEHFHSLHKNFQRASQSAESLGPQMEKIWTRMNAFEEFLGNKLHRTAKESSEAAKVGLDDAKRLQQALEVLLQATRNSAADFTASHEMAVQESRVAFNQEVEVVMAVLSTALGSVSSLHSQLEASHIRTHDIFQKQADIEASMKRLEERTERLTTTYSSHDEQLEQAQQKAAMLAESLKYATTSAENIHSSMISRNGWFAMWPFVVCPLGSLVLGSYGLQPSLTRNIWLIGFGELAGLLVSGANTYANILASFAIPRASPPTANATFTTYILKDIKDGKSDLYLQTGN